MSMQLLKCNKLTTTHSGHVSGGSVYGHLTMKFSLTQAEQRLSMQRYMSEAFGRSSCWALKPAMGKHALLDVPMAC